MKTFGGNIDGCTPEMRTAIIDTLSGYAHGHGSAPVRRALEQLKELPTAGNAAPAGGPTASSSSQTTSATVDEDALLTFMHVYLVFLVEVTKRRGFSRAGALLQKLLNGWEYAKGFTDYKRCMFYAMFDTTSLWILCTWISSASLHSLTGVILLLNLVVVQFL